MTGAAMFARFASPPNQLGHCGTDDAAGLLELARAGGPADELRHLATTFEAAWPYLQLIAAANGIDDPLDPRVVGAYWIGGRLLDRVSPDWVRAFLGDGFAARLPLGASDRLGALSAMGFVPNHAFHVLALFPLVGLLRSGRVDEPVAMMDRCRIRWAHVESVDGERVVVRARPLALDGPGGFRLGEPRDEIVDRGFVPVTPGDDVALHWGWVCHVLNAAEQRHLVHATAQAIALASALLLPEGGLRWERFS